MNYINSIKTCLNKFFVFKGRASRSEFWYFALTYFVIVIVLTTLSGGLFYFEGLTLIEMIFVIALIIPYYAAGARRLHDLGKSGWWQAAPPIINYFSEIKGMEFEFMILGLVAETVLLIFLALPGHKKDNRFGKKINLKSLS